MSTEQMHARHLVELGFLQDAIGEMGHSSRVAPRSSALPYHTLIVDLDPDAKGRPRQLAMNYYPIDDAEFSDSLFLQYFITFPFALDPSSVTSLAIVLTLVNTKVVLGHFGIDDEQKQLHFRYVQVLPSDEVMAVEKVANAFTLVSYTPRLFQDLLEDVATGSVKLEAAITQVRGIYADV